MTPTEIRTLAEEIKDLITSMEVDMDVTIYFNGIRWLFTGDGKYREESADVNKYLEYHGDILSMSFEGALYEIFNYYCDDDGFEDRFNAILKRYGLYYEMGNSWNLSLYEG